MGRRRARPDAASRSASASRWPTPTTSGASSRRHEAGHATVAWLVAPQRRLEVLTIIKRREALGLLAHGDREDVYTRSRAEMTAPDPDRDGRPVRRGALLRRRLDRPGRRPASTRPTIAAQMVGACGMTDTLVSYAAVQNSGFSDTNLVGRVLGDAEGRRRGRGACCRRRRSSSAGCSRANQHLVAALRDALLERHELIGREITDVLEQAATAAEGRGERHRSGTAPSTCGDRPGGRRGLARHGGQPVP